ncbi:MAG: transglutaminase domain-containing protein, partial [Acidobacteriaceae bacterium]
HLVIEHGAIEALDTFPVLLPPDVAPLPEVHISTASSWNAVAKGYASLSEPQIHPAQVAAFIAKNVKPSQSREELVRSMVQALHDNVRYTGVEFGVSAYIPQPAVSVLDHHYGDCKDKAALLVAMLRQAKIPAYLALLKAQGEDVRPGVPGFGEFNHAIVYVPGSPDYWIDATAVYAPPSELPVVDQGRLALIVRDSTTELVKTPISSFDQNLVVTQREVTLSEFGPGKVRQIIEPHGVFADSLRSLYDSADSKSIDAQAASNAKFAFGTDEFSDLAHTAPRDLSKPFTTSLSVNKAPWASSDLHTAVLWIPDPPIREWFPYIDFNEFSETAEHDTNKTQPKRPRTTDFVFPAAFVHEWRYRITPPAGFQPQALLPSKTTPVGPARLIESYTKTSDGAVLAKLRFELPKSRLTVAEVRDLVKQAELLEKGELRGVKFDNTAYLLLSREDVQPAVAEFRRMVALHPKEALHHVSLSEALLQAGLGETARREAEEATTLEPKSAQAWAALGKAREFDLVGREHKKGWDRAGALQAYNRALELDAKNTAAGVGVAIVRALNDDGVFTSNQEDLKASIEDLKKLAAGPEKDRLHGVHENLLNMLFFAGRYEELLETSAPLPLTPKLLRLEIAATALVKSTDQALELAREKTQDEAEQSSALLDAAAWLISARRYHEALPLQEAGASLSQHPASYSARTQALRGARRYTETLLPESDPRSAIQKLYLALFGRGGPQEISREFSHVVVEEKDRELFEADVIRRVGKAGVGSGFDRLSNDVVLDWFLSNFHYTVDGNAQLGYRIRADLAGSYRNTALILREDNAWKLVEYGHAVAPAGLVALTAVAKGDEATARQWIDWGRDETEIRSSDDPLFGPVFPRMWTKGQAADRETLEKVAAVMVSGSRWSGRVVPILQRSLTQAKTEEERIQLRQALCAALFAQQDWKGLADAVEPLAKSVPQSDIAFRYLATAYIQTDRWNDLERIAHERLTRIPDDLAAVRELALAAVRRGDMTAGRKLLKPVLNDRHVAPSDLNTYAWTAMFTGGSDPDAIEAAQRANSMTNGKNFAVLHTLGCLLASSGKVREARQTLLQAMDADHLQEPNDAIWFGFGLIAEGYGEPAAALSAYSRIKGPKKNEPLADSTFSLARHRIEALQQKPGSAIAAVSSVRSAGNSQGSEKK